MPAPRREDRNAIIRRINATLQGPVMEALGDLVPEVRNLPRRTGLEVLLDDVDLLHRCFLAFRTHPDHFRHLLVNRHKVPVEDAEALLECGRSLDQVIAMVVRTAAKRHFRRRLGGKVRTLRAPAQPRRAKRQTILDRLRGLLAPQPRTNLAQRHPKSRAETLYEAFQEYLLHDWQVPMIPEYSQLSPGVVRQLGARILDYRIAEDIRRLRVDPDNPPPPTPLVEPAQQELSGTPLPAFLTEKAEPPALSQASATIQTPAPASPPPEPPPAAISTADERAGDGLAPLGREPVDRTARDERARLSDILTFDGKRLRGNAFTLDMLDPEVRAAVPEAEQTLRVTTILDSVNGMAAKLLVGELGLRSSQLAVFLLTAHAVLGDKRFDTAFGVPGRPEYVARMVERAKLFKISQETPLAEIGAFVVKSFKVGK